MVMGKRQVPYEGQMLLPFAVLQNVFGMSCMANAFSFNGDHFYDLRTPISHIYGHSMNPGIRLNPYATAYYSGKFSKETMPAMPMAPPACCLTSTTAIKRKRASRALTSTLSRTG